MVWDNDIWQDSTIYLWTGEQARDSTKWTRFAEQKLFFPCYKSPMNHISSELDATLNTVRHRSTIFCSKFFTQWTTILRQGRILVRELLGEVKSMIIRVACMT